MKEVFNPRNKKKCFRELKRCFWWKVSRQGMFFFHVVAIIIFLVMNGFSQPHRIWMDGKFDDWQQLSPIYSDASGDQSIGNLDFGRLWVGNDDNYLFMNIELGDNLNIQEGNRITLYIDYDNDTTTGLNIHGIGAEMEWVFGEKSGTAYLGWSTDPQFGHSQIELVTQPTVTSTQFEISMDRHKQLISFKQLSDSIRIVFKDNGPGEDLLPDNPGGVLFTFNDTTTLPPIEPISIKKSNDSHFRVMTHNVLSDGLFDSEKAPAFDRILKALQPDIIGFQEIYNHTPNETKQRVASVLPLPDGEQWYAGFAAPDILAVSRFPIIRIDNLEGVGSQNNGAFLLDLSPQYPLKLMFIVAHTPCCNNDWGRQYEIDAIMSFIRDAKRSGGIIELETNTPILVVGDMNLVGDVQQLNSLLTGEIINSNPFGQSDKPDWDETNFTDLLPRHPFTPMYFTWINSQSEFGPGRLDVQIYSDSVMEPVKSFVLYTPDIPSDTLSAYNLNRTDATTSSSSDHLPVVSDFVLKNVNTIGEIKNQNLQGFKLHQNYPNPFNATTNIIYYLAESSHVDLDIFSVTGERIKTLVNQKQSSGLHQIRWDGTGERELTVASGIYIYRLTSKDHIQERKMLFLK